jgi:hypothetical protein
MTNEDFILSLSNAQADHFNKWIATLRNEYHAAYETNAANLVAAKEIDLKAQADKIDALSADKARLTNDLAEKTAEYDTTKVSLDAKEVELTASKEANDKLVADHAEALVKLVDEHKNVLDVKQVELDAANTKIAILKTTQRFDPRKINAVAFYNRITKDQFAKLAASPDPQLTAIAQAILAYAENEKVWPVEFDSVEMQGMIGYLLKAEFLTQEQVDELTKDATWQEAFYGN